jgi:hypothetical protein
LERLPLEELEPAALWAELDDGTRRLAAESLYGGARDSGAGRAEADRAIAAAIRFRPVAVRRLPVERRVGYLLRVVRPDDALATSLLLALHLERRVPLLEAFLDRLEIPQQDGAIDDGYDLQPPPGDRLAAAVDGLEDFPRGEVEIYLASLVALDPDTWGGLVPILRERFA